MIFKTFDSDVNKLSSKWGMFGRSFSDIGTAFTGQLNDIRSNYQTSGNLFSSIRDSQSMWKRLFPTNQSIRSQPIDVDALYPKIDDNFNFNGWIKKLNKIDKKVKAGTMSWQDYYNKLKKNEKWIAKFGQQTEGQIRTQEDFIRANEAARSSAMEQNRQMNNMTFSGKASNFAAQALKMAGNMLIMYGISEIVSSSIKYYDSLITTLDEASNEFNNQKAKLEEYQSQLDSLGDKLTESKEKIEELNTLKSSGDITSEQLEELALLKEQTKEYQVQYDLLTAKTEAQKNAAQASASELISLHKKYDKLQNSTSFNVVDKLVTANSYNPFSGGYAKAFEWITSFGGKQENMVSKFFGGLNNLISGRTVVDMATGVDTEEAKEYKSTDDYLTEYKSLQEELNALYKSSEERTLTDKEYDRILKIKEELGNISSELLEDYEENSDILKLYKSDENSEKIFGDSIAQLEADNKNIMFLMNSIDPEQSSIEDMQEYIKYKLSESGITDENYIESIINSGTDNIKLAVQMFKDGYSFDEIKPVLSSKENLLDKLIPNRNDITSDIQYTIDNAISQVDPATAMQWAESLTEEELKIANSKQFEQALEKQKDKLDGAALSADDYANALEIAKEKLDKLNSPQDTAKSTILDSIDQIKKDLSSPFKELSSAYSEIFEINSNTGGIDFSLNKVDNDMLSGLKEAFSELEGFDTSNIESFFNILSNGQSRSEQVQQAFDDIATAYLNSSTTLKNLNSDTADSIAKQLEELGIANAKQAVYDTLNAKEQANDILKRNHLQTQDKFNELSYETQVQLLNEANASDQCRSYIAQLQLAEINFNKSGLDTSAKIEKLLNFHV